MFRFELPLQGKKAFPRLDELVPEIAVGGFGADANLLRHDAERLEQAGELVLRQRFPALAIFAPRARDDLAQLLDQVGRGDPVRVAGESVEHVAGVPEQKLQPRHLVDIGPGSGERGLVATGQPVTTGGGGDGQQDAPVVRRPVVQPGRHFRLDGGDGLGIVLRPSGQFAGQDDKMLDPVEAKRRHGLASLPPGQHD